MGEVSLHTTAPALAGVLAALTVFHQGTVDAAWISSAPPR